MGLLSSVGSFLNTHLETADGATVTYTRSATSLSVIAVWGESTYVSVLDGAIQREHVDRDYMILAEYLTIGEPEVGDRITDEGEVFEVIVPGNGKPAWEWSDKNTVYRIHCKRVA